MAAGSVCLSLCVCVCVCLCVCVCVRACLRVRGRVVVRHELLMPTVTWARLLRDFTGLPDSSQNGGKQDPFKQKLLHRLQAPPVIRGAPFPRLT